MIAAPLRNSPQPDCTKHPDYWGHFELLLNEVPERDQDLPPPLICSQAG